MQSVERETGSAFPNTIVRLQEMFNSRLYVWQMQGDTTPLISVNAGHAINVFRVV